MAAVDGVSFRRYSDCPAVEGPKPVSRPERNLLAAVLSRAIMDMYGQAQTAAHERRAARLWLLAEIDPRKSFSFAWIAEQLQLCPYTLQTLLREYEKHPEELLKCLDSLRK